MSLSVYYDTYFKKPLYNPIEIAFIQKKLMLGQYTPFDALRIISSFNTACVFYQHSGFGLRASGRQKVEDIFFSENKFLYKSRNHLHSK